MHFNIFSEGICGKVGIFHNVKNPIEVFFLIAPSRRLSARTTVRTFIVVYFMCVFNKFTEAGNRTWTSSIISCR